mgnify:CR=1 FL=1
MADDAQARDAGAPGASEGTRAFTEAGYTFEIWEEDAFKIAPHAPRKKNGE